MIFILVGLEQQPYCPNRCLLGHKLHQQEMWFDFLFEDIQDGQCFKVIAIKFIVLRQKR